MPLNFVEVIKELVKILLFQGGTQLGGALWFLQSLFYISCGYALINYMLKRINRQSAEYIHLVISIVFLIVGYMMGLKEIYALGSGRFFSYYILFHIGGLFKKNKVRRDSFAFSYKIVLFIAGATFLWVAYYRFNIEIVNNRYVNPIVLLLSSIAGWIVVSICAINIERKSDVLKSSLSYVSVNSMSILGLHFLSFKVISYIIIQLNDMKEYSLAMFPVIEKANWWILYVICGITFPLMLNVMYKRVRGIILHERK